MFSFCKYQKTRGCAPIEEKDYGRSTYSLRLTLIEIIKNLIMIIKSLIEIIYKILAYHIINSFQIIRIIWHVLLRINSLLAQCTIVTVLYYSVLYYSAVCRVDQQFNNLFVQTHITHYIATFEHFCQFINIIPSLDWSSGRF